jgi:hypothetical protein
MGAVAGNTLGRFLSILETDFVDLGGQQVSICSAMSGHGLASKTQDMHLRMIELELTEM